jgi:hypothetical protein
VDVVSRDDPQWQWLRSFIDVGRRRLADLGQLSSSEAESLWDAFTAHEATDARMITPAVLEIIATRTAPL